MINLFNINNYVIDTSDFSNQLHGKNVTSFEESFCDYVGAKYACSINSATNAIFLSTLNKDISAKIPSTIPPVVLNAVLHAGNSYSFKDDVDWIGDSYVLHDFGDYKIVDSAQKVERGQFLKEANDQDLMIFSFYPTKPVGGIDGGIIVSNDADKISWFKEASMNGMSYSHNNWERTLKFPGWKMYMNSFQAEVAIRNLNKLDEKKEKLNHVRERYNSFFGLSNTSEHLYRIKVQKRDQFILRMKEAGIVCGIHYRAAHLNPVYSIEKNQDLPNSVECDQTTVSIPYHENLSKQNIDYVLEYYSRSMEDLI